MDWISPLTLYYNYDLIFRRGQYWRIISSFLFFGSFSLDFLFHLYFVVKFLSFFLSFALVFTSIFLPLASQSRYCRLLEEGRFRGRAADFMFMMMFGIILMVILACSVGFFSKIRFLGHSLSFMMVYVWGRGRENANVRMSLLGLYNFNAPYLPWVLLAFSLCLGNPIETDFLGIIVGHLYYFLDHVYPQIAESRGWILKKILVTPILLHYIFSSDDMIRSINDTRVLQAPVQRQQHGQLPDVDDDDFDHDGFNENDVNGGLIDNDADVGGNNNHLHQD